mmetsp:Transcript_46149/g.103726  ORF Transcript_46149/g.103726 Transcript_46149/m.103726 type:complete len:653 (+) Transcript_46149:48-2006(+)
MGRAGKWVVAIPSYDRLGIIEKKTLRLLLNAGVEPHRIYVFADPRQLSEYEEALAGSGVNVLQGEQGIHHQRNAIMRYFPEGQRIVEMDDDVHYLRWLATSVQPDNKARLERLPEDKFQTMIEHLWDVCDQEGCCLWGVFPNGDQRNMSYSYSCGLVSSTAQCQGYYNPGAQLKLECRTMEDYERILEFYAQKKRCLRCNFLSVMTRNKAPGGCDSAYGKITIRKRKAWHLRHRVEEESAKELKKRHPDLVRRIEAPETEEKELPRHGHVTYHPPGFRVRLASHRPVRRSVACDGVTKTLGLGVQEPLVRRWKRGVLRPSELVDVKQEPRRQGGRLRPSNVVKPSEVKEEYVSSVRDAARQETAPSLRRWRRNVLKQPSGLGRAFQRTSGLVHSAAQLSTSVVELLANAAPHEGQPPSWKTVKTGAVWWRSDRGEWQAQVGAVYKAFRPEGPSEQQVQQAFRDARQWQQSQAATHKDGGRRPALVEEMFKKTKMRGIYWRECGSFQAADWTAGCISRKNFPVGEPANEKQVRRAFLQALAWKRRKAGESARKKVRDSNQAAAQEWGKRNPCPGICWVTRTSHQRGYWLARIRVGEQLLSKVATPKNGQVKKAWRKVVAWRKAREKEMLMQVRAAARRKLAGGLSTTTMRNVR